MDHVTFSVRLSKKKRQFESDVQIPSGFQCEKKGKMSTLNFSDLDFLIDEIDDSTLSQVCEQMEEEEATFVGLENLSISQMVDKYDMETESQNDIPEENMENLLDIDVKSEFDLMDENTKTEFLNVPDNKRFGSAVTEEEIKELLNNQENKNTKKKTKWAVKVFQTWRQTRIQEKQEIPELKLMTNEEMNYFLGRFVVEAKKQDGNPYPPRSVYLIVCGLLRYLRDEKVYDKNFLDTNNLVFSEFRNILDAKMKELLSLGYGTKTKQADPILPEDESILWDKDVFGDSSSESLQCTVFFYSCKLFGLRGHDEHHDLQCEQFTVGSDNIGKFVQFDGKNNKTYKGGLKDLTLANKSIRHHCQEGPRCIADYFEKYLNALGNRGHFYRRPLAGKTVRYGEQIVGVNKLKNMIKVISERGGLIGNFSNHSGKRTCATQLYIAGIDEQEIMERTGHRSEKGVRKYKQSNPDIQKKVSFVLDPPQPNVVKRKLDFDASDESCNKKACGSNVSANASVLRDVTNGAKFANCQIAFNFN